MVIWMMTAIAVSALAQKNDVTFDIVFKGNKIGFLKATEEKKGSQVIKDIKTQSDTKVLAFAVHVESELHTIHEEGALIKGTAYRHASRGAEDVHSNTERKSPGQYVRERNGKKTTAADAITMCVADLYFREPKGLTKIYSNMYAEFVALKSLGKGKYQLTTPDKKNSFFSYENEKLVMMEVETPVGKVVTKRV